MSSIILDNYKYINKYNIPPTREAAALYERKKPPADRQKRHTGGRRRAKAQEKQKGLTYGASHDTMQTQGKTHRHKERGLKPIADHPSKTRWEAENIVRLTVKINRNQDPDLFELFTKEQGSRSNLARTLLRAGLTNQHERK